MQTLTPSLDLELESTCHSMTPWSWKVSTTPLTSDLGFNWNLDQVFEPRQGRAPSESCTLILSAWKEDLKGESISNWACKTSRSFTNLSYSNVSYFMSCVLQAVLFLNDWTACRVTCARWPFVKGQLLIRTCSVILSHMIAKLFQPYNFQDWDWAFWTLQLLLREIWGEYSNNY